MMIIVSSEVPRGVKACMSLRLARINSILQATHIKRDYIYAQIQIQKKNFIEKVNIRYL